MVIIRCFISTLTISGTHKLEGEHRKNGCNGFLMQEKYSSYGCFKRGKGFNVRVFNSVTLFAWIYYPSLNDILSTQSNRIKKLGQKGGDHQHG